MHLTTPLQNNNGHLHTAFKAPDVYGVFQFKIDYKRTGYTFISSNTQVCHHTGDVLLHPEWP